MRSGAVWCVAALALLAGCGGGGGAGGAGGGPAGSSRTEARFDVDVKSGKVTITPTGGRAVYQGGAVSFTSSDLLTVGGDAGQRLIRLAAKNNSGETWGGAPVRLTVSSVVNAAAAAIRANVQVSTYAGSGSAAGADGYRTAAQTGQPAGICAGAGPLAGSLIVCTHNSVRRISPDGMVTTLAGDYATGGYADGPGSAARFWIPGDIASDAAGNIFLADAANNRIRRITPAGEVTTVAGSGLWNETDGAGPSAAFRSPRGIAVSADGTRIYVTDSDANTVRRINLGPGQPATLPGSYTVTTIAGTGAASLVDGAGASATFSYPQGLALYTSPTGAETLFLADGSNCAIRRIDSPTSGSATVTTIIGDGVGGDSDGPGNVARLRMALGIAVRPLASGSVALFITDTHRCRQAIYTAGTSPTQKGSYVVTTLAGSLSGFGSFVNGDGTVAMFVWPENLVALGDGNGATLYVADSGNHRIRRVTVPGGALSSGAAATAVTDPIRVVNWDSETPNRTAWVKTMAGSDPNWSTDLQFYIPNGVSGFSFLATIETESNMVSLPAVGAATLLTLAGNGIADLTNGTGTVAQFLQPAGIVAIPPAMRSLYRMPSGAPVRAFIADFSRIRYLDTNGFTGTWAGGAVGYADGVGVAAQFFGARGMALMADGSLVATEYFTHHIRRIWPNGQVTTIAGTGLSGTTDGAGDVAQFFRPEGITVQSGGRIYVADTWNHAIRRIELTGSDPRQPASYSVTTIAGLGGAPGYVEGSGDVARFAGPTQIAADSDGRVYVADTKNNAIRVLAPAAYTVTVTTLATGLNNPTGLVIDPVHNLYVSDYLGNQIRRISPGGVSVLIGTGAAGFVDGPSGTLYRPYQLAIEASGSLLVSDMYNSALRVVQRLVVDAAP